MVCLSSLDHDSHGPKDQPGSSLAAGASSSAAEARKRPFPRLPSAVLPRAEVATPRDTMIELMRIAGLNFWAEGFRLGWVGLGWVGSIAVLPMPVSPSLKISRDSQSILLSRKERRSFMMEEAWHLFIYLDHT